ncbi:MAG: hypothetical protein J6J35_06935 [Alphaproteobacteria bacterium]|nr:hypothetical protein [Alphaproteobacteria bacterium]
MKKNVIERLETLILDCVAKKDADNLVELLLLTPEYCENLAKKVAQCSSPEGKKLFSIALNKAQHRRLQNAEHEKSVLEYLQTYSGRKNIEIYTEPYWRYLTIIGVMGDILPLCKVLPNMTANAISYLSMLIKQECPKDYICFRMFLSECKLAKVALKSMTEFIPRDLWAQKQEECGLTEIEAAMYLIHLKFVEPHKLEGAW